MPSAAVKFPSEPPPTVHSPSERLICFARDLARAKRAALIFRSRGGRPKPPVISRRAPLHGQFGFANSFARRLQQAARAEGRLKDKNGIAAPRFRFEEVARRFASDLLVGRPKEDDTFAKGYFRLQKRLQREKRLNDSGLHVKDSRAVSFAAFQPERHPGECSGRVDRIVVAQHEELAQRARFAGCVSDAQKIATMLLRDSFHARAVGIPFLGEYATASIGGGFIQAG